MATTFLPTEDGGIFVRWVHAHRRNDVVRAVQVCSRRASGCRLLTCSRFVGAGCCSSTLPAPAMVSSTPRIEGIVSRMRVPVPGATYDVDTADYEADDHTRVILHRLRRSTFTDD